MIGLSLITFVAILGAGLRASFGDAVDKLFVANYALTAANGFDPFTKQADDAVAVTPGVTAVSPLRGGDARVFGHNVQVSAVTSNLAQTVRIDWLHGTTRVPAQLGRNGAFVSKDYAKDASPSDRLGNPGQDTDGPGAPPSAEGNLRPTEGRFALRHGDHVRSDVRRQLSEAAELDDAHQHQGRCQRQQYGEAEVVVAFLPGTRRSRQPVSSRRLRKATSISS